MGVEFDFSRLERVVAETGVPSVGHEEGRFLYLLTRIAGAKNVLELGCGVGYSAAWFAHAVGPRGLVVTIEVDPSRASMAEKLLSEMGLKWVRVVRGDALELLPSIRRRFDLVFVDILRGLDHERGFRLGPMVAGKVREGGLIVADNAQAPVAGAQAFLEYMTSLPGFEYVTVPYREGVLVGIKGRRAARL